MRNSKKNGLQKPMPWMYFAAYAAPYFLLMATALFWPEKSNPFDLDFSESLLARMVPSISAYIDKSAFPHTTAAYFVLSGIFSLPTFILILINPTLAHGTLKVANVNYGKYKITRMKTWGALAILVPIGIWTAWHQPGYQFGIIPISDQRWALALFGFIFSFYSMACYLLLLIRGIVFFETIYNLEREHHGVE